MDNRNMRHSWWGGGVSRSQSGLKGRPLPRLAPPPEVHSPHEDLINYIYESWDKISREGNTHVWEPPTQATPRPCLPPLDLEGWWGRRLQRTKRSS